MENEKKRRPGRPSKKPPIPPLELKGIVNSPMYPEDMLEFVYGDPTVFKSLFTYFKNVKTREIHLRCNPQGLTFFARDHSKTSRIVAHVAGEHVNWHYCEGEIWLGINRDNVEKMFSTIDKSFFKITILYRKKELNENDLIFIFKDPSLEKECEYRIQTSTYTRDDDLYDAEKALDPASINTTFPVEFTLSAKQFKKSIGDASHYSDTITIEKIKQHILFTYEKPNMKYIETYRVAEKIKLRSSIPESVMFGVRIKILNVKSLANSMVTDDIRILCRGDEDILFRSALDEKALVVSTLTKIS